MNNLLWKRMGRYSFIYHRPTTVGITIWRRGGISLQWRGHFFQAYVGDWMAPVKGSTNARS